MGFSRKYRDDPTPSRWVQFGVYSGLALLAVAAAAVAVIALIHAPGSWKIGQ